jgi:hypothetical protein
MGVASQVLHATTALSSAIGEHNATEKRGDWPIWRATLSNIEPSSRTAIIGGNRTFRAIGSDARTGTPKDVVDDEYDAYMSETEQLSLVPTAGLSLETGTTAEFDTTTNADTEAPASDQISGSSSTGIGYTIRAPVPYPEFGYFDTIVADTEDSVTAFTPRDFANDVMDTGFHNDVMTGGKNIESINAIRIDEDVSKIQAQGLAPM